MKNKIQKLNNLKNNMKKRELMSKLSQRNLKGGMGCPPPWIENTGI